MNTNATLAHCLAGVLLLVSMHASLANADGRPNVLFIACDDMNDWVGFMKGHPDTLTPNMDRLAQRGVVFDRAYCASPICGPSRAAVLTGLKPETSGVYNNTGTYVDYVPDAVALPRFFKNNGYLVMGAGKINHAMGCVVPENYHEFGPDAGAIGGPFTWEELNMNPGTKVRRNDIAGISDNIASGIVENIYPGKQIRRGALVATLPFNGIDNRVDRPANGYNTFDWGPVSVSDDEMPDGKMAAWAEHKLKSQFTSPFFLAVGFYRPHQPWYAPAKYFKPFAGKQLALPPTIANDLADCGEAARQYARYPWSGSFATVQKHKQWQDASKPSADWPESSPVFRADVDRAGTHQYTSYREPAVVRTKSGRLIVGVHAGNRLGWPERSGQDLVVRLSDDNGKTWGPIVVAAEHGNFSCQCHGLVYDADIDRVLFLYTVYNWDYTEVVEGRGSKHTKPIYERLVREGKPFVTSYRVYSDAEGRTWSKPVDITGQVGRQAHFGASEGRQLTTGDHKGRLLIAGALMDLNETGEIVAKHPGVWRSDDHGETWTLALVPLDPEIATPRNASSEARITELADGRVLYNERTRSTGRHLSWSNDGGETWTKTSNAGDLKVTQCNGCTITLRDTMGNLTNTVLFSIPSPGGRSDGLLYVSNDGGRTWPIRRDVVKGFFAYSALIQLDAETIGLFYEANRYKDIRFVSLPMESIRSGTRKSS